MPMQSPVTPPISPQQPSTGRIQADENGGGPVSPSTSSTASIEYTDLDFERDQALSCQQEIDQILKRSSANKSMSMLGVNKSDKTSQLLEVSQRYEEYKKQKVATKRLLREVKKINTNATIHQAMAEKTLESKATTTRKFMRPSKNVLDPETVPGMKCAAEIDREKEATRKALELVNYVKDVGGEGFQIT